MNTLKNLLTLKLSRNGFCARKKAKGRKIKHCEKKIENGMSWPRQKQHNQNEPFVKRMKQTLAIPMNIKANLSLHNLEASCSSRYCFFLCFDFFFVKFFFVYDFSFALRLSKLFSFTNKHFGIF